MRFCDLFISYKIGLKGIKSTIPFTKLPLYRKIFVIIFFASAIVSGILLLFKLTLASYPNSVRSPFIYNFYYNRFPKKKSRSNA